MNYRAAFSIVLIALIALFTLLASYTALAAEPTHHKADGLLRSLDLQQIRR